MKDFLPDAPAHPVAAQRNPADHTRAHSILVQAVRVALVSTGRVLLWPNPSGFDARAKRSYGLGEGSADTIGTLIGSGRFFAVECKTGDAKLEPNQEAWHRAVHKAHGFATVARSVTDALEALERAAKLHPDFHICTNSLWMHFE